MLKSYHLINTKTICPAGHPYLVVYYDNNPHPLNQKYNYTL